MHRWFGWALLAAAAAAARDEGCTGPEGCTMLGECVDGKCVCDRGYTGDFCERLDLGPAPTAGAVKRGNATWGGHPILLNGTWHMYVSDVGPCGLHKYKSFSRILHMKADNVEGPYEYVSELVPSFSHNAYATLAPTGELLVYYIGEEHNPGTLDCDASVDVPWFSTRWVNVIVSASGSPYGPWRTYKNITRGMCSAEWCTYITNPAPLVLPNGTTLMAVHGNRYTTVHGEKKPGLEEPGIAVGESFAGPFSMLNPDPLYEAKFPWYNRSTGERQPPTEFHGEDMFIWKGRRAFHMVWHVKEPFSVVPDGEWGDASQGLLSWSMDGRNWHPAPRLAYDQALTWASSPHPPGLTERQRPQLVFADPADPYRPTHAFFGVQTCPDHSTGAADYSWNQVVPFH
eukprot:TRINITY_DN765_c1_g1_i2.p2 TRINITY_DN765_c1_g1~~TRINITY_DN765_c1_g1_i2.p2  ORF type:complete len:400 (+),score=116.55 TRINITY_DN765_c1_g1_i2:39-1238(+)